MHINIYVCMYAHRQFPPRPYKYINIFICAYRSSVLAKIIKYKKNKDKKQSALESPQQRKVKTT